MSQRHGGRLYHPSRHHTVMQSGYDPATCFLKKEWKDSMNRGAKSGNEQPGGKCAGHFHMLDIAFIHGSGMIGKKVQDRHVIHPVSGCTHSFNMG